MSEHVTGRIQAVVGTIALAVFMAGALVARNRIQEMPRPWLAFEPGHHYIWSAWQGTNKVAEGIWGNKNKKQRYERRHWAVLGDDGLMYQVEEITNPE
jgi:hypothetical protein